jgi:AmmeMemoRadiSam system protein B
VEETKKEGGATDTTTFTAVTAAATFTTATAIAITAGSAKRMKWGWLIAGGVSLVILLGVSVWLKPRAEPGEIKPAQGLLIPHHLLAEKIIREGLAELANNNPQPAEILLIVPNHQEVGSSLFITGGEATASGSCLGRELSTISQVSVEPKVVAQEHAATDITPFITQAYATTRVIPLLVSSRAPWEDLTLVRTALAKCSGNWVVIAAIDFSHYLSQPEANTRDQVTWPLITERAYEKILRLSNEYVDSPKALVLFLNLMEAKGAGAVRQLIHENSGNIAGDPYDTTTSYFSAVWN